MPKQKAILAPLVAAALFALTSPRVPVGAHMRAWHAEPSTARAAATAVPQGFVLPSSDVDVKVSSLVAADLDDDGDLDIVASEGASGSVAILVWENDGAGRLTRREPKQQRSLEGGPASPSFERHQRETPASVQTDSPAMEPLSAHARLVLATASSDRPRAPGITSPALDVLRSRSPPSRS